MTDKLARHGAVAQRFPYYSRHEAEIVQTVNRTCVPLYSFWQPRYWPAWLGIAVLRLIICLPQAARMACGRFMGRWMHRLLARRSKIARQNLQICFPDKSEEELDGLALQHFESLGMSVVEQGIAWWCSDAELSKLFDTSGLENIEAALAREKGVLLISGHFGSLEMNGRNMMRFVPPMSAMYRPSNNPFTDQIMRRIRGRSVSGLIPKDNVRALLKSLRKNTIVWYAADQAYSRRGTVLADFFGEPATTNTAITQIAKVSGAAVVPFFPLRLDNGRRYRFDILPMLDDFPGDSPAADALRINQLLEARIRLAPEQYYWVHRRFKGRPDNLPDPY